MQVWTGEDEDRLDQDRPLEMLKGCMYGMLFMAGFGLFFLLCAFL